MSKDINLKVNLEQHIDRNSNNEKKCVLLLPK